MDSIAEMGGMREGKQKKNGRWKAEPESFLALPGDDLPKREIQGEIRCPRKQSQIAIMRCGEYQEQGCKCERMASRREIEFLKISMAFRDRQEFKEWKLQEE